MRKMTCLVILVGLSVALHAQQKDSLKVYWKCRNDLSLDYLFKNYDPMEHTFQVKGARLIESRGAHYLAIMPDSSVAIITIKKKGQVTDQALLYSKQPPPPIFDLKINGKYISIIAPSRTGSMPTSIEISPLPDEAFRENVPKDAIYKIQKWEISISRGTNVMAKFMLTNRTASPDELNKIKSVAKPGDTLHFKVIEMNRQNAVGEVTNQPMPDYTVSYTIQ